MMIYSKLFSLFPYNFIGNAETMEDDENSEDLEILMVTDAKKKKKHKKKKRSHSKYENEDSDRRKKRRHENKTTNNNKDNSEIIELFSSVKRKERSKSYSEEDHMHIKKENNRYKGTEEIVVDDDSDVEVTRTSKKYSRSKYRMRESDSDNYNYSDSDIEIEIENIYEGNVSKTEKKYNIHSSRDHSTSSPRKKHHKSNCRKVSEKCRDDDKKESSKSDDKKDEKERSRNENNKRSRDKDKKERNQFGHKKDEKERSRYENGKGSRNEDKKEKSKSDYKKDERALLRVDKNESKQEKAQFGHDKSERDRSRYENNKESRDENKKERSKYDQKKDDRERSRYENNKVSRDDDKKESSKTNHKNHERDKYKKERSKTDHKNCERERLSYDDNERFEKGENSKTNGENQASQKYPSRSESLTHCNILKDALKIIGSNSNERLGNKSKSLKEKSRPNECSTSEVHKQKDYKTGSSKQAYKSSEMVQRSVTNNNIDSDSQLTSSVVMKINKNAEIDIITEVRPPQKRKKNCSAHQQTEGIGVSPIISTETIKKENENTNHQTFSLLHNNMSLPISPFLKKNSSITNNTPFTNSGNLFRIESVQGNIDINNQNDSDNNLNPTVSQMSDIQNSDVHVKHENASNTINDNVNTKTVANQKPNVPYIKIEELVNVHSETVENQKPLIPYIKIEEIVTQNEIHSEVYDQVDSKAFVRSMMNNEYLENSASESKVILHKNLGLDRLDTVNISIINTQENIGSDVNFIPNENECSNLLLNNSENREVRNDSHFKKVCDLYQASLSQYESTTNDLQQVPKRNMLPESVTSKNLEINILASVRPVNNTNTNTELNCVDLVQPETNTNTIIKLNSLNSVQTENDTNKNIGVSNLGSVQLEYVSNTNIEIDHIESLQAEKDTNTNIELNSLNPVQPEYFTSANIEMNSLNTVQPPSQESNGIYSETSCSESPMCQIESVWSTATRGATASEDTDNCYPIPEDLAEVMEDLTEVVEIGRVEVTSTSTCSFRIKKENEAARNYYVTHRDIKNCPMCQHELDIDRFKFNPSTMIFTMLCVCNMTIYQLLNPEKYKGCKVR